MRRRSVQITLLVVVILVALFTTIPRLVDENQNKILNKPPYPASERALTLHRQLTVADLHADSLLWGRDLLQRSNYGHIDIPRLADGNVAVQIFSLRLKVTMEISLLRMHSSMQRMLIDLWKTR